MYRHQQSSPQRFALLIILILGLFAPAASAAGRTRSGHPFDEKDSSAALSYKDRLEVFEDVWETIYEKYYDPSFNGVNWRAVRDRYRLLIDSAVTDAEFYSLIKRMVGELRDAHTRFHSPRERREREHRQTTSTGISIHEVEGEPVVVRVEPDSDASRAGVEPGMSVIAIDGKPIATRIAEAQATIAGSSSERATRLRLYRRLLEGEPGGSVVVGLARADGSRLEATLTRRTVADSAVVTSRRLQSGFGYIGVSQWRSPVHKSFKRALEQLRDTSGLIIDLRGNPGGEVNEVLKIAGYFFLEKVPFGRFVTRVGRSLELYSERESKPYRGAIAILVNESSGSGSEMFAGVLQENGRASVIGRRSCGCLLGIAKFKKLEGGSELAVSELGYLSPKGRRLEGTGVVPNEAVALRLADIRHGRDAPVEEAEHALARASLKPLVQSR